MEQVHTQAPQIKRNLIDASVAFYQDLLGYAPEQTSLQQIPENQWNEFAEQRGLNPNSSGIYLPRNQAAVVRDENPLSLFHEYFGHGLYCEQNLTGRKLVELEKKLLEEEKQEFSSRRFTLEDLQRFRQGNLTFQELENFRQENLVRYELFAIWTEYLLSEKYNLKESFQRKYPYFNKKGSSEINHIIGFSKLYGELATFYEFGFARVQDEKRLLHLSKDIFKTKLNKTPLLLHFGSGKLFSDVDLFAISNEIVSMYSNWLDVRAYNLKEAEDEIKLLNSKIIFPIFEGKFILGDKDYLKTLKEKILNQEITEQAIRYNLEKFDYHKKRSFDKSIGKYLQDKNLRSSKIHLSHALAMKQGYKILTFKELIDYSHKRFSHSEKIIELKGGLQ
ncbi:MAG: hypothetical protein BWY36_00741 [Candidatus Diapherotrites archaeon ADurb.Bin253]|nr:MAG: hypothetical protein BWY36_00741 [Candidatus Diapherotrites archaeon ADurb.Bin253]